MEVGDFHIFWQHVTYAYARYVIFAEATKYIVRKNALESDM